MLKVGVVGATGYAGAECVRILLSHPEVTVAALSSVTHEGRVYSDLFCALRGYCDLTLTTQEAVIAASDLVFCALPAGLSEKVALACVEAGKKIIDIGADFRLEDPEAFQTWYKLSFQEPKLHEKAVYCIPELHADRLAHKSVIANPGCYPTAVCLAAAPVLKNGLCAPDFLADAKSGLSGAGRQPKQSTHFVDVDEGFCAYQAGVHRHTPEIEQCLSDWAQTRVSLTFVPHLLPLKRGILATLYLTLNRETAFSEIDEQYRSFYEKKPFVRVLCAGEYANINHVTRTNLCEISLHPDLRNGRLVVCSAIDNMVKGAAGQAVQNMNLRYGFDECAGLCTIPAAF